MPGTEADYHGGSTVRSDRASFLFQVRAVMSRLWVLAHLLYLSAEDIRERQISMQVILGLGGSGLWYAVTAGHMPSLFPGCLVLVAGYLSRERIGYGDGWLLLAMGMWMDTEHLFCLLFGGMASCFLCGICFRRRELPLVPFLTAVYIAGEWL